MNSEGLEQLCAVACESGAGVPGDEAAGPASAAGAAAAGAGGGAAAEIRVLEVDAFASVQDLIHAAILANKGAASLKEIYAVCQTNGRIAYKRAGGSRLITANDHWKSQIRHALYTGGRFQRVAANQDLWQLAEGQPGGAPQLVKVLVRADEAGPGGRGICAAVAFPASAGGRVERDVTAVAAATPARGRPAGTKRPRASRKRSSSEAEEGGEEEEEGEEQYCPPPRQRQRTPRKPSPLQQAAPPATSRRRRQPPPPAWAEGSGEVDDEAASAAGGVRPTPALQTPPARRLLPTLLPARGVEGAGASLSPQAGDSASAPSFGPLAASEQQQQRQQGAGRGRYRRAAPSTLLTSPSLHETPGRGRSAATPAAATPSPAVARAAAAPLSAGSSDPSNLRWGSTGLRSSIILPADSLQQGHSSLSAGRTPLAGRLGRVHTRGRAASAEAESPAACHGGLGEGGQGGGCPRGDKRCRVMQMPPPLMLTPMRPDSYAAAVSAAAAAAAAASPLPMGHWEAAMKRYHEQAEAALAQHQQHLAGGEGQGAAAEGSAAGRCGSGGGAATPTPLQQQQQQMMAAAAAWAPLMFSPAAAAAAVAAAGLPFGPAPFMPPHPAAAAMMLPFMQQQQAALPGVGMQRAMQHQMQAAMAAQAAVSPHAAPPAPASTSAGSPSPAVKPVTPASDAGGAAISSEDKPAALAH